MLRSIKSMQDYKIKSLDDHLIGTIHDFYFNNHDWSIPYIVVELETTNSSRKVLISSEGLMSPAGDEGVLTINFAPAQIETSPEIDLENAISFQQETALRAHYGWSPLEIRDPLAPDTPQQSAKTILNYYVQARDGDAGHVEDFLIEDQNWTVQYLIVDTRNWLPGRKVWVSPSYITRIERGESMIYVDLNQETIENSPEYEPEALDNQTFETKVHDHQDQTRAWLRP